ncbi:MAG: PD-(D/E)XK nuclease family protein [Planctomycetes bacterium]|nr:PD-(D/E)XK nuclease family protein [Planctomycetota bacterium]
MLPPGDKAAGERADAILARLERAAAVERDASAEVTTVSEVLTWQRCPRQALYRYVVGDDRRLRFRAGSERGLLPPDLRGTLAHEVLAQALRGSKAPSLPAARWIEGRAAQLLVPEIDAEACQATASWARDLARTFLASPLGVRAGQSPLRSPERPILAPLRLPGGQRIALRGTLDLLFRPPEGEQASSGWVLVDYKAGDLTELEVPERLAEDGLQLQLYAVLLEAAGISVSEAWVAYLVPGVATQVELDSARAFEVLSDHQRARQELELPARPGVACETCPWASSCDAAAPRPALSGGSALTSP